MGTQYTCAKAFADHIYHVAATVTMCARRAIQTCLVKVQQNFEYIATAVLYSYTVGVVSSVQDFAVGDRPREMTSKC